MHFFFFNSLTIPWFWTSFLKFANHFWQYSLIWNKKIAQFFNSIWNTMKFCTDNLSMSLTLFVILKLSCFWWFYFQISVIRDHQSREIRLGFSWLQISFFFQRRLNFQKWVKKQLHYYAKCILNEKFAALSNWQIVSW